MLGLKFLSRKDLFADDCSFDFVYTKDRETKRETFLQCYKVIIFIPLLFKISSASKQKDKTCQEGEHHINRLFKAFQGSQERSTELACTVRFCYCRCYLQITSRL